MWHVATTEAFDQWFTDLDEDGQAELIAKVELLKLLGPNLARPHADTPNGSNHANMKELRVIRRTRLCVWLLRSIPFVPRFCWLAETNQGSVKNGFTKTDRQG